MDGIILRQQSFNNKRKLKFVNLGDRVRVSGPKPSQVQFGSRVREEIALNQFNNTTDLKKAIDNIEYMTSGTMTGEALKYLVTKALLPSHGSRLNEGIHTIAIIITDGKSQDYHRGTVTQYQREAKDRGVEIFAIGVGKRANEQELMELASIPKPQHVYEVESFDAIEKLDVRISGQEVCDEDECVSGSHECDQICINTDGSYECRCRDGYDLLEDKRSCLERIVAPVPDNLQFTQITHTSSEVSWDIGGASDDAVNHYLLVYARTDGVDSKMNKRIYGNRTTSLIDLEPQTKYKVSVLTVTESDISSSVEGTFTTLTLGRTKLVLSNATLTTLTATWKPAGGDDLTGYELLYQPSQSPLVNGEEPEPTYQNNLLSDEQCYLQMYQQTRNLILGPDILKTKLTGLNPDTVYYARIMPLHGELVGGSASDEERTEALRPPFVKVMNTTLSTFAASWNMNTDFPIATWSVAIFPAEDEVNQIQAVEIDGSTTETIFHGLNSSKQYRVEVKGHVDEGGRRFTSSKGTAFKKTKLLKKPKVSISNITQTSFTVRWKELNVMADSWTVKVFPVADSTIFQKRKTGRRQRSVTFENLLPSTMYRVDVIGHAVEDGTTFNSPKGNNKAKTKALTGPPVEVGNASLSSLTGVWQDINIPVDNWIVRIFIDGGDAALQEYQVHGSQHSQVFTELPSDTTFRVEVHGRVNQGSMSLDSPLGKAQGTTKSGLDYDAPYITCDNLDSPSSLFVEWPGTDYKSSFWMLVVGPQDNEELLTKYKLSREQYSYKITELQPSTTYLVEVYGELAEESSTVKAQSGYATCTTEPLTAPPVEVTATTYLSIAIRWEDINMPVDTWTIHLLNAEKQVLETIDVEGNEHELQFSGLRQGTYYDFQVIGHVTRENTTHDSPIGATSGTTRSFVSVAGPRVECLEPGLTSITVLWSDVSIPVNSWTIHYYPEGEEQLRKDINDINSEDQKEKIITRLRPATLYTVEIIGNVQEDFAVFQTEPGIKVCPTKSITAPVVEVLRTTYHSLIAKWDEINVQVDTWLVTISNEENGWQQSEELQHGTNEFLFTGLDQDTLYDVQVIGKLRAENLNSPPGKTNGTTKELDSPFIECHEQSMTNFDVSWVGVPVSMDSWTITVFTDTNEEGTSVRVDGERNETKFVNLIPDTAYTLKFEGSIAQNGKIYTTPTEYISCATEPLRRPEVNIIGRTTSSLQVQWDHDMDIPIDTWTVTINRQYGKQIHNITVSGEKNQFNFEDLLPQTSYSIRVVGQLRGKKTPPGRTSGATMPLTPPSVEINNPSLSTLTVRWGDINMDMTSWIVTIKEEGNIEVASKTVVGNVRDLLFDGLQPSTNYEASVIGKLVARETTRYSPPGKAWGTTESIDAPHVTCYNTTATSVAVSWTTDEVTPTSHWTVRIAETGTGNYAQAVQLSGFKLQYVFERLRPSTTYVVAVVGNIVEDETTFSSSSMQDSCTTKPLPPHNIVTTERGITNLIAKFEPPSSLVDDYEATCTPTDGTMRPTRGEVNGIKFTVDCQNLDPATEHIIRLKAMYRGLFSDPIQTINTTLTPPPSGLTLSEPTTHTMLAEWQAPDADVDRYYVSYNSSDDDVELRVVSGSRTSLRLIDLEPNTLYHVRVQAEMKNQRSCPIEAAESTLSEIIQLQIDDVGYTAINVSWNASSVPHVKSYCLEYGLASDEGDETQLDLPADVLKHTIKDLRTATEYKLSINARYLKTKSEETEKFATTLALPPIGPMTFTDVTESSFIAHWLPPVGTPQPKSYTVTYFTEEVDPITVENVPNPSLLIEGLTPETLYDVTVSASYDDDLVSHPIRGQETTLDLTACSCSTYLKSQRQMQSMLMQMMDHINVLNEKIDRLTSSRSTRSSRRQRRTSRVARNK